MNHKWKQESLQNLIKYNKWLLGISVVLSLLTLVLGVAVVNKEEKWVMISMHDIDNRFELSNSNLKPSYLKHWSLSIAKEVFTTSPDQVVNQHADIRKISVSNKDLKSFFANQLAFIQGNNASSVFYPKATKPVTGGVLVTGTLHYWFAGSNEKIALEKTYLISYKEASRGVILLSNIEERK